MILLAFVEVKTYSVIQHHNEQTVTLTLSPPEERRTKSLLCHLVPFLIMTFQRVHWCLKSIRKEMTMQRLAE